MNGSSARQKIAILGGGMASLTTAYELTNRADWREQFESITVYQLGWRLGGKGASGRGENGRIEEHGLHIWLGFYENAFRLIRNVYAEMNLPPDRPLATFEQAFTKQNLLIINERIRGQWETWPVDCPTSDSIPGDGGEFPSLADYVSMLIQVIDRLFAGCSRIASQRQASADPGGQAPVSGGGCLFGPVSWAQRALHLTEVGVEAAGLTAGEQILDAIHSRYRGLGAVSSAPVHAEFVDLLDKFRQWLQLRFHNVIEADPEVRRPVILLDLALTTLRGLLEEGVLSRAEGLDYLDQYDLREWLQKHGASEDSYNSGAIRFLYDLAFAYRGGDSNRPSFAAGTALRCIGRVFFTYKGAIFWKMQAGMGDTIFAPLYKVLVQRGVRFEFFHRVKALRLTEDQQSIARIELGRQVTLKNGAYEPLFKVKCLDCWPSAPFYDQIVEGQELRDGKVDLESFWTAWQKREFPVTLEAGTDFDVVVLGISLGSLEYICKDLVEASVNQEAAARWTAMVRNVETTRTMGLQLWLKPDLAGLGWKLGSPVMDGYEEPLNTWADMSHLLPRECWPADHTPGNLAYLCGTVTDDMPPVTRHDEVHEEGRKIAQSWLENYAGGLWPNAIRPDNAAHPNGLDWDLLVDTHDASGEKRLESQFWRINMDPSERYVLSVKGSTPYRLKTNESGFQNLYLVGDWIDNGFNAGCIEATVMSGMLGSNAVAGYPAIEEIIGYPHKERGAI